MKKLILFFLKFINIIVLGMLLNLSLGLSWDEVDSSKSDLNKAYKDYDQAIRSLTDPSQEKLKELEKQIIVPAQHKFYQARQQEILRNFENNRSESIARDKAQPKPKIINYPTPKNSIVPNSLKTKSVKSNSVPPPKEVNRPQTIDSQIILDGSNIPKEIEFQKKSKQ